MGNKARNLALQLTSICLVGALAFAIGYQAGASKIAEDQPRQAVADDEPTLTPEPAEEQLQPSSPVAATIAPATEPLVEAAPFSPRQQGFRAAETNLEQALEDLSNAQGRERVQFTRGVFEYLAEIQAPELSLELANLQDPQTRSIALRALVSKWGTAALSSTPEEAESRANRIFSMRGSPVGIEAELTNYLSDPAVSDTVKDAWIQTFADHPGRSEIKARIVAGGSPEEIQAALAASQNWTEWERRNFSESLVYQWTRKSPEDAWIWYQQNGDILESPQADLIVETWANRNPEKLLQELDQLNLGEQRQTAIETLSKTLASRNTLEAMNWADSLADPAERDLAYQSIYDATPKGIGARVGTESGFLRIEQIMPEGALRNTEVQAGDLIVEARELGGETVSLYGRSLSESIGTLRGAPGSQVEIRYLRRDPTTGQLIERTATVTRDLLVNEG